MTCALSWLNKTKESIDMEEMKKVVSLLEESLKMSDRYTKSNQGCQLYSAIKLALSSAQDLLVFMESCQ